MNIKELKQIIECNLKASINFQEKLKNSEDHCADNARFYYMTIGEISTLQRIGGLIGINKELFNYDPYETKGNDQKFNYCGSIGKIGDKTDE